MRWISILVLLILSTLPSTAFSSAYCDSLEKEREVIRAQFRKGYDKYLSEKLDVDVSKISATSHLIDDLDSDDWTNLEVIIEVGEKFNRPITDEEADGIETVQDIFDIISN